MQGATVTPFAMAYRNQMTGELGYTKQDGYDRWEIFKEQVIRRFGPTHEDVKALRELYQLKYKGDIDEFLQQIESKNNRAKVTGIALRKIVEDQVPEEAIRRMSLQQEYIETRENGWKHFAKRLRMRKISKKDESSKETLSYTAKEKRVYQAAKKEAAKVKKETAVHRKKIIQRVWITANEGIDQKEIDECKAKGQCTRCTFSNHGWKHCEKDIRISAARMTSNPPRKPDANTTYRLEKGNHG